MAASFHVFKNGAVVAVTNLYANRNANVLAHGNPAGDAGVTGKFSTKVRTSGPVSGDTT